MKWVFGIALLIFLASLLFEIIHDFRAKRAARAYCDENEIKVIELKAYKNAYGVYFKCDGKRNYARFTYYGKRKLKWAKESPLEVIQKSQQDSGGNVG